jgi:hypothetical protein
MSIVFMDLALVGHAARLLLELDAETGEDISSGPVLSEYR